MTKLKAMVQSLSKDAVREVILEELPGIVRKMAEPGDLLSDFIDYDTVSTTLGISKTTIFNYIKAGKLTKYTFTEGGKPFLRRSEIMKLLKGSKRVKPSLN